MKLLFKPEHEANGEAVIEVVTRPISVPDGAATMAISPAENDFDRRLVVVSHEYLARICRTILSALDSDDGSEVPFGDLAGFGGDPVCPCALVSGHRDDCIVGVREERDALRAELERTAGILRTLVHDTKKRCDAAIGKATGEHVG